MFSGRVNLKQIEEKTTLGDTGAEMGIYWNNLSAIVIGDNLLPIIAITQSSFDFSITDRPIAFVIYFVIADKLSR